MDQWFENITDGDAADVAAYLAGSPVWNEIVEEYRDVLGRIEQAEGSERRDLIRERDSLRSRILSFHNMAPGQAYLRSLGKGWFSGKGDVIHADFGFADAGDEAAKNVFALIGEAERFLGEMQRRTAVLKTGVHDAEFARLVRGQTTEMARLALRPLLVAIDILEAFIDLD